MNNKISSHILTNPEVAKALRYHLPIVALESTVITHGLPYPENIELANDLEREISSQNVVPATIAILHGKIHVGLTNTQKEELVKAVSPRKISRRDFGIAIALQESGGTTVAGTMIVARQVGIKVFATGGIGGVHRNAPFDVSADLPELSHSPLIVICAGAKAILDLPATVEYLETMGVPIIGYQTDDFPAFYSRSSGLPVNSAVSSPKEIAKIARAHWDMGLESAILVVAPPPEKFALSPDEIEEKIQQALTEASQQKIIGSAVTPFLLKRVSELSSGSSLRVNLDLLHNNANLAAQIAIALQPSPLNQSV